MKKIWTKEAVLRDAKQFSTLAEWRENSPSAYVIACRNKWNSEASTHMTSAKRPAGYWTPARIKAEAKKYKTVGEWRRANGASYAAAKKQGLVPKSMPRELIHGKWTKARIAAVARQCSTRGEFRREYPSAYTIAATKGWLEDVCSHTWNRAPWFGPRIIREFLLRHDIGHFTEYKFRGHGKVARLPFDFYLPDFRLVIEYQGRQHKLGWNKNAADARKIQARDDIKRRFARGAGLHYLEITDEKKADITENLVRALRSAGKAEGIRVALVTRRLTTKEREALSTPFRWNEKRLKEAIASCSMVKEFREKYPTGHAYALSKGLWEEYSKGLRRINERGKFTFEYVSEMASRCRTKKEFRLKYPKCHAAARRHGWIPAVCAHMPNHLQKPWLG